MRIWGTKRQPAGRMELLSLSERLQHHKSFCGVAAAGVASVSFPLKILLSFGGGGKERLSSEGLLRSVVRGWAHRCSPFPAFSRKACRLPSTLQAITCSEGVETLSQAAEAATTKCLRLSGLNNRNVFRHSSGGCKAKAKALSRLVPSEVSGLSSSFVYGWLLPVHLHTIFTVCPHLPPLFL